jgi:hypothetical protein
MEGRYGGSVKYIMGLLGLQARLYYKFGMGLRFRSPICVLGFYFVLLNHVDEERDAPAPKRFMPPRSQDII